MTINFLSLCGIGAFCAALVVAGPPAPALAQSAPQDCVVSYSARLLPLMDKIEIVYSLMQTGKNTPLISKRTRMSNPSGAGSDAEVAQQVAGQEDWMISDLDEFRSSGLCRNISTRPFNAGGAGDQVQGGTLTPGIAAGVGAGLAGLLLLSGNSATTTTR